MTGVTVSWGSPAQQTLNCQPAVTVFGAANAGSPLQGSLSGAGVPVYQENCTGLGTVTISLMAPLLGESSGGAFSLRSTKSLNVYMAPSGRSTVGGTNVPFTVPWTNPSGPNAAKFTFSHTLVGYTQAHEPVYLSATLTKMGAGLTLS